MYLKCECGNVMTNVAAPNTIEHLLLSNRSQEHLQDLVDEEVSTNGQVDLWPEHWEESGAIDVWKCQVCGRLYLNARGNLEDIVVYKIEKKGLNATLISRSLGQARHSL
jgi:hypothetical protein